MTQIELKTVITGLVEDVFETSRSIDFHVQSAAKTQEKAIAGVTSGPIGLGQSVTWRGKHFGLFLTHTSKIVEMVKNQSFTDVMTQGHFTYFVHQHRFRQEGIKVIMYDKLQYKVPYGFLGRVIDSLFIKPHLSNFITERNNHIKSYIEKSAT
ncbi:MAG: SRPBCC family protein [Gilvibacter sp.]